MHPEDERFEALQALIDKDMEPAQPLRLERWFFPILALLSGGLLSCLLWYFSLRSDHQTLGRFWLWGLSTLELAAATLLLGLSLRHAIPGRILSLPTLATTVGATAALNLTLCWLVFAKSPTRVPEGQAMDSAFFCFSLEVVLGLPVLLLITVFLRRGLVTSVARAGILGGLGAGLIADTLWRLICPYSDPLHALTSHTSGILALGCVGLLVALLWDRARLRAWPAR